MSKKLKRILAAAVAVVILAGVTAVGVVAADETPTVSYDGNTQNFSITKGLSEILAPFNGYQEPDLFVGLKEMMPGDSRTQNIELRVKNMDSDRVKIYMAAIVPDDVADNSYNELFVDQKVGNVSVADWIDLELEFKGRNLTVADYIKMRNGTSASPEDGVEVGYFYKGGPDVQEIDVKVAIDLWADNTVADKTAVVDWYFYAVEENDPTPPGPNPPEPPGPDEPYVPSLETHKHINYIIGFDDGLAHPEANLTRAQAAGIFYRLLTDAALIEMWSTEPCYPDVPEDSWYFMYVATLTNGGILTGYPDGNFLPDQPITRAEFATMVARFDTRFGELETTVTFPDIEGKWYQEAIEFAATCGYVHGYPDGNFLPDQYINRAEAVALINHCLERHVDEKGLEDVTGYINWPDNSDPNIWYYYEIIEAANYHDSNRSNRTAEGLVFKTEDWTKLHEPIDWEKIEQEWIQYLTGNKDFVTDP